jgi:hypothetical protein
VLFVVLYIIQMNTQFILYSFPWEKMFHVSVFIIIITTNESFHPEKLCRGRHLKRKKKFFSRPFRNRHRRVYKKLKKMKLKKKRAERSGREWTCRLRRDEWLPQDSKYIKQLLLFYFVNTLYLSSLYNSVTLFFLPKKVLFIFRHQKTVKREETIIKRRRRRRKHILKTKGDFCARGFFQSSTDEKRKFSCPSSLFVSNLKRAAIWILNFLDSMTLYVHFKCKSKNILNLMDVLLRDNYLKLGNFFPCYSPSLAVKYICRILNHPSFFSLFHFFHSFFFFRCVTVDLWSRRCSASITRVIIIIIYISRPMNNSYLFFFSPFLFTALLAFSRHIS